MPGSIPGISGPPIPGPIPGPMPGPIPGLIGSTTPGPPGGITGGLIGGVGSIGSSHSKESPSKHSLLAYVNSLILKDFE